MKRLFLAALLSAPAPALACSDYVSLPTGEIFCVDVRPTSRKCAVDPLPCARPDLSACSGASVSPQCRVALDQLAKWRRLYTACYDGDGARLPDAAANCAKVYR